MPRYIERNPHDWFSTIWRLTIFVGMILFAILVIYPWRGLFPTVLLLFASLWTYIALAARQSGYLCGNCGKVFQVPTAVSFFSTSSVGENADGTYYSYKRLTCPHCGKPSKARLVKRVGAREARGSGRMLR